MSQRRLRSEELIRAAGSDGNGPSSRDELMLGTHTVAYMSGEFGRVNALRSTSALGMPAIEVLAGLTSQTPTGVVLVEHDDDGLAFCLERGRVVGAFGTGDDGLLETWCESAQTQGIQGKPGKSAWIGLVAAFIERCVLERLELATRVGSNLTVIRGEVEWADSRLELSDSPSLSNLLMEHAREEDESTKFEKRLHPLERYVFPSLHPDDAATSGVREIIDFEAECSFAGMAEDLDVDVNKKHDMRVVWNLCDGRATISELSTRCLLGRARTLEALDHLRKKGCIDLSPAPPPPAAPAPKKPSSRPPVDFDRLHSQYRDNSILQELIESFIGNMPGWLAELDGAASRGDRAEYARLAGHIIGASGAVAAMPLLEVASEAQNAAFRTDADLLEQLEKIETAYADAFRELLSVHAGR